MSDGHPGLTVTPVAEDVVHAVFFRGEADIATAAVLADALSRLPQTAPSSVTMDLHDLTFLDVGCGRLLASYCRSAAAGGCEVTIRNAVPAAVRVLELFDLQTIVA